MHSRLIGVIVLVAIVVAAAPAAAQEKGQLGLQLSYSGLGLVWHATENFALRPAVTVSRSWSDATYTASTTPLVSTTESHSWALGVGLNALFYMRKYENLRTYFTPGFGYSRSSGTSTATGSVTNPTSESVSSVYAATGSYGAQYSLGKRFTVFGELGVGYSRARTTSGTSSNNSHASSVAPTSRIGAILYF
jgi:opacity protein-like surface antigen